jgi:hypothetical protein
LDRAVNFHSPDRFDFTTVGSPDGIIHRYTMSDIPGAFAVASLRVHDEVEGQTFDVNLEDVVRMLDDPNQPGKHRSLIIALLNGDILDRYPYAAEFGNRPLPVTIDEFSDIKLNAIQKLLAWVKSSGGVSVQ